MTTVFYRTWTGFIGEVASRRMEWFLLLPLCGLAFSLWVQPDMFSRADHYRYLDEMLPEQRWEMLILSIALMRVISLLSKAFFSWPYYSPFGFFAAVGGTFLWGQFAASFLANFFINGTVLAPVWPYATLALIEIFNVVHCAQGVGELFARRKE